MGKRIQIPRVLYDMMADYILDHYDENDIDRFNTIIRGMKEKSEATLCHSLYSIYKSAEDPIKKETARQIYLDRIGMRKDFRWQEDNKQLRKNF